MIKKIGRERELERGGVYKTATMKIERKAHFDSISIQLELTHFVFIFTHSLLGYYLLRLFAETGRFPCFSLVRWIMLARLYLTNE